MDSFTFDKFEDDKYPSFEEIYKRSKKYDDYEYTSTEFTRDVGLNMWCCQKYLDSTQNKVKACRILWTGLKVGFYLKPESIAVVGIIFDVVEVINRGDREIRQIFKKLQDKELVNYPNPNEHQAEIFIHLNKLLR